MSNQGIDDQKLESLQNAYSNIKYNVEEEIENHRESHNLIKLLEDKFEETEAKFIRESKKFKAEKESRGLEDSNKAFKVNTIAPEVEAEAPADPPAKFGKSDHR